MDLKELGIRMKNWIDLAQDRENWRALENVTLNLWVPQAMDLIGAKT